MARPVIGITTYVTPARWSHWELEAALVERLHEFNAEATSLETQLISAVTRKFRLTLATSMSRSASLE